MSAPLELIAIISPKAGKVDRVVELIGELSKWVYANEPTTLKYQLVREVNKKSGVEEVIMLETYADKKALAIHGSSEKFKQFSAALKNEDLVSGPMQVKFVAKAAGFSRL